MKKLFVLLLVMGLLGVNIPAASSQEQVVLTFETSVYVEEPHKKAIDALVEAYNQKNPNVKTSKVTGSASLHFFESLRRNNAWKNK